MRKTIGLMFGLALIAGATQGSAQENKATSKPGYIGIRYDAQYEIFLPDNRANGKVIVNEVSKDSPAEKAGLKAGDEVIRINGMSTANGKFTAVARTLTEGDTVRLRIKRGTQERDYTLIAAPRPEGRYSAVFGNGTYIVSADSIRGLAKLWMDSAMVHLDSLHFPRIYVQPGDSAFDIRIRRFGRLPEDTLFFRRDSATWRELRSHMAEVPDVFRHIEGDLGPAPIFRSIELGTRAIAGAEFADLDPAMKTYFGTDSGLLTLRVAPETPAARAGLQPGDIVKKANGREVTRVANLRNILFETNGSIKLEVLRKGDTKTIEIKRNKGSND